MQKPDLAPELTRDRARRFEALRPRLNRLAYRMFGSIAEAEDVVQDAFLRWVTTDADEIRDELGWLSTVTTRLALDRLRSFAVARTQYIGQWLPVPMLATPESEAPDHKLDHREDLSMALLMVLERLAPQERAAFLLHESFELSHGEIAQALEITEASSRQLVHRARERVRSERRRFEVDAATQRDLIARYAQALNSRDPEALTALLRPDVTLIGDGGGQRSAARNPVLGRERVVRMAQGLWRKLPAQTFRMLHVNGELGIARIVGGELISIDTFGISDGGIAAIWCQLNPDKLPPLQHITIL